MKWVYIFQIVVAYAVTRPRGSPLVWACTNGGETSPIDARRVGGEVRPTLGLPSSPQLSRVQPGTDPRPPERGAIFMQGQLGGSYHMWFWAGTVLEPF